MHARLNALRERLTELLSSFAFFVPGNIGLQEGSFVEIGGLLGLDAPTCLALAGGRRVRDLPFFVPGLVVWELAERSFCFRRSPTLKPGSANGK